MNHAINYDSLLIISMLAFITPILSNSIKKFAIPVVVVEITLGIIIGKSGLNLIGNDIWIHFLSSLGLAYLMFLSGLEIDFDTLKQKPENNKEVLANPLLISVLMFAISIIIAFICAGYLANMGYINNIYLIALIFTASAPGIITPVLKQTKIINSTYGQTLLIFSILCEFIALTFIAIVISIFTLGINYENFLFIIVFLVFFIIYFILKKFFSKIGQLNPSLYSQHIRVRAAFALILILVTISHKVGSEIILGAFLAGIIFSLITDKTKEDLKFKLETVGYGFLIPIFFIMVGVNLDIKAVIFSKHMLAIIPIIILIIILSKVIPSLILTPFYGVKKSISAGILLSSQLSLMIVGSQLAYESGIINQALYSTLILVTIVSSLIFPSIFTKLYGKDINNDVSTAIMGKLQIKELVLSNPSLFNKPIQDIRFPESCRIFLIIRNLKEIIPSGNVKLKKDDHLIVIGFRDDLKNIEKQLSYNE